MKSRMGRWTTLGFCLLGAVSFGRTSPVAGEDATPQPRRAEAWANTRAVEAPARLDAVEDVREASGPALPWDSDGQTWLLGGDVAAYDVAPCGGNGVVNLDDILGILAAFGGDYACSCPGAGETWTVDGADIYNSNAGNVGVGTSLPAYPLHVSTAGVTQAAVYAEHAATSGALSGVYGVSVSTGGNGVYGIATALSGVAKGVYGQSESTDGYGVYGYATAGTGSAYGGRFRSNSTSGIGVYSEATADSGINSGVYGVSDSTSGRGVGGEATAGTGITYGGRFESNSTSGIGVFGFTPAVSGDTRGVYGRCDSTDGYGVFGETTAGTGINYGVYGKSDSPGGRGIRGEATAGTGITYGVSGQSDSVAGRGVSGFASAASGTTYGVYGQSVSTSGRGVYGWANAATGTTYGVYGECNSPDGFAGYFSGPVGSRNYFARSIGIGVTSPDATFHVADGSDASLSSGSGYVVLGDASGSNLVIDNNEIIARNNGSGANLYLNNEGGSVGILRNAASHPLHVGNDNTNGNGAHLTAGGTWTNGSSREFKHGFEPIDKQAVLRKVVDLPVTRWQYKGEADDVHHVGPVAQDFRAAFDVGHDERYITTIDADGVALAAIQGLHEIVQEKNCEISQLKDEVAELRALVHGLIATWP